MRQQRMFRRREYTAINVTEYTDNQKSNLTYSNITQQFVKVAKCRDLELTGSHNFEETCFMMGDAQYYCTHKISISVLFPLMTS